MLDVYLYGDFLNENANISTRNRTEMCDLAYSFKKQKLLIFTLFILTLLSIFNMTLLYFIFRNKEVRRIYSLTHPNLKFILVVMFMNYTAASLNSFVFFTYKIIILFLPLPACSYIIDGLFCFYSQFTFVSLCPVISFFAFFAAFLERCYTSIGFRIHRIFGLLLASVILLPALFNFTVFDPKIYQNERLFCASFLTTFESNFTFVAISSIIFEFAIGIGDFLLVLYNKRRIRIYK